MHSESLILFFIVAVVLVGGPLLLPFWLHPFRKSAEARSYECGIHKVLPVQFNVGYYLLHFVSRLMWKPFLCSPGQW